MKTKKLKPDEINWEKMKLKEGGNDGYDIKYNYLKELKGRGFIKRLTSEEDVPPHDDLIRLFRELRSIVATVENIDYVRKLPTIPGFDPTDNQASIMEGIVQKALEQIEVTGISLSERRKESGVIISYKKYDINDQVTGTSTTWISLSGNEYGIEEELSEIVSEIKQESYEYEFNEKYADFEQMAMEFPDKENEAIEEVVEAEEIE